MRVLVTSYFYEFRFGGAELVARTLKRNLEQQRAAEVDVLCLSGSQTPEPETNIHRLPTPSWWWRHPQIPKRVILFLNNRLLDRWVVKRALKMPLDWRRIDLIHCQDFNALRASHALATRFDKPLVFTLHDGIPKRMHPGQAGAVATRLLDASLKSRGNQLLPALKATREVICVSEFIRDTLDRFFPRPATVIYPPAEEYLKHIAPANESGTPDDTRLLFIGRLSREKGIDLLLRALAEVPQPIFLSILGLDGPLRTAVEKASKANSGIRLLAPVPHSQIQSVIREHDIICCPSMFEEPFGKTVFEARLSSKPIVASSLGGIPEITHSYRRAAVFDPIGKSEAEIVREIARCISAARALASEPLDCAEEARFLNRFSLEHALEAHATVYQRAIAR